MSNKDIKEKLLKYTGHRIQGLEQNKIEAKAEYDFQVERIDKELEELTLKEKAYKTIK